MKLYPRDKRFDDSHLMLIGMTGSGKSYKAVQMAFSPPLEYGRYSKVTGLHLRTIFFDTSNIFMEPEYEKLLINYGKVYPKSVMRVHTPEMFGKAWDYGARWIVVSPRATEPTSSYRAKVLEILRAIRSSQAEVRGRDRWPLYIYFDEVSDLVHKMKENPVTFVFKRGRQLNMWGRAISQRPQLVNKILFNESKYQLYFHLKLDEWEGLRTGTYRIRPPLEVIEDLYKNEYLYYIYDGHAWIKGKVRA